MELFYFDSDYVVKIHQKILVLSGGIAGVKNIGNIESPLVHIQNDDYYPTFEKKLTHLVFCLNKFHGFNDGNKRSSIGIGAFFLEVNGLEVFTDRFIIEMENIAVAVADNIIDKDLLHEIIYSILNEPEYNEALKIKIVNCMSLASTENTSPNEGPDFYRDIW